MTEPLLRLAGFLAALILNEFCAGWMRDALFRSAGKNGAAIRACLREVQFQPRRSRSFARWLVRTSPDPGRTRRALFLSTLEWAPCIVGLNAAVLGLAAPIGDRVYLALGGVVLADLMVSAIAGAFYRKRHGSGHILGHPIWVEMLREMQAERRTAPRGTVGGYVRLALFLGLLAGLAVLIYQAGNPRIPPANREQVITALSDRKIPWEDWTETRRMQWDAGNRLSLALIGEDDRLRLEFYIFDTVDTAGNVGSQLIARFRESDGPFSAEGKDVRGNFGRFTARSGQQYFAVVRVENTLITVRCPLDERERALDLLTTLRYLDP